MAIPSITHNAPSAGHISWGAFNIQLNGVAYSVPAASSNQRWVWWEYKNGAPIINAGADVPATLTDDDLVLFANKNGIGVRVQSTNFVDGELLVDGSIFADALSTNLINSQHIVTAGLDAGVIKFGTMNGDRITVGSLQSDRIIVGGGDNTPLIDAVQAEAIKYVQSRGSDLVTNGTGFMGDNTNFSQYTYVADDAPTGITGSFRAGTTTFNVTRITDELIPIDPSKRYQFSFWARQRSATPGGALYGTVTPFDATGKSIAPIHYMWQDNTHTTLAAPLNPGDTTMTLTSSANWHNVVGSAAQFRNVIFWDYVDSFGKLWPQQTYSRNTIAEAYLPGNINGNVITLKVPYSGAAKPAGTKVSNGGSGGSYMYSPSNVTPPEAWTFYSGVVSGVNNTGRTSTFANGFPPGTSFVKVGHLLNRDVTTSDIAVAGVSFSDAAAANSKALEAFVRWAPEGVTTISGSQITTGTIESVHVSTTGLSAAVIKFGQMSGDRILANTINSGHVVTQGLDAGVIRFGEMSGDRITANTINSGHVVTAGLDAGIIKFGEMSGDRILANTLTSKQIMAGSILASSIDVENLTTAIISTGLLQAQLTITGVLQIDGANMGWSGSEGLWLGNGTRFYGDERTNQIEGDLVTESLTIKDGLSIGGDADLHGELALANGITTPTTKMALSQTWPRMSTTMASGTADQSNIYQGLYDYSATEWLIAFNYFGAGMRKVNKTDGSWTGDLTLGSWKDNFYPQGGLCAIGSNFYMLGSDSTRNAEYYIYKLDNGGTINKLAEIYVGGYAYYEGHRPRLVSNGTNVGMVWTNTAGNLVLRWYNPNLTGSIGSDILLMADVGKVNVGDAYYGPGESGGPTRLWVSLQQGDGNMVRCYTTAGVRVPGEDFPRAGSSSLIGLGYDTNGGSGRMYHYDKTGIMWTYSKYTAGGTLNAQYTYYDGDTSVYPAGTVVNGVDVSGQVSGPHETPPSPLNSFALSKRAWPTITAPPAPDELVTDVTQVDKANRLGIYASVGGTPRLQEYLPVGNRTLAQTDALLTSGALAGSSGVATFASASVPAPGRLRSSGVDVSGQPLFDLLGSGAGRMGPARWDATGKPLNHGEYVSVTTGSVPSATFTTRQNWSNSRSATAAPAHGIAYSAGNFTIAQSGLWFLTAGVTIQGVAQTNGRRITTINVNGNAMFRAEGHSSGAAQDITPVATGIIYLAAGDVITIQGYHSHTAALNFTAIDEQNFFSAYCLAAF